MPEGKSYPVKYLIVDLPLPEDPTIEIISPLSTDNSNFKGYNF